MTRMAYEDCEGIVFDETVPWGDVDGRVVVVTGATGLLGGLLARALLLRNKLVGVNTKVVLPVRNPSKAAAAFGDKRDAQIVLWDASTGVAPDLAACDLIVHCASNTDSRLMVERPVDTIDATVHGTHAMLDLARATGARLCFLSSMEVYGAGSSEPLDESHGGELDAMNVRSSYPQAKQLAETLVASYAAQYGVCACAARLAQSFGPGIAADDCRVFAEFARRCLGGKDIELLTDGSKSNMYVYTADAVRALLVLVTRGVPGEAYNVANEATLCSIYQMAQLVAREFGTSTEVTRVVDPEAAKRYAVSGKIALDTSKMQALGWRPRYGLGEMYERMIRDWEEQCR